MTSYIQQPHHGPAPGYRSRSNSSNASKYIPESYTAPPHTGKGYPNPYGAPVASRADPLTSTRAADAYGPPPGAPVPQQTGMLHPARATNPPYPVYGTDALTNAATIADPLDRRHSYESTRSRRSHDSRDSHRSHRSHRTYDADDRERHHHHHRHRHEKERERRHRRDGGYSTSYNKRIDDRKPTFGDTIFAMLGGLRSYLGPRDRY